MSTRGAYGFRAGGVDKITYNHSDSYPEGLGAGVVMFIRAKGNTDEVLGALAEKVRVINPDVKPTEEEKEMCRKAESVDLTVGGQSENDWYCLLRKAQGELPVLKKLPLVRDASGFMADSLFCEYAYIINTDTGMLEVYRGFNKDGNAPGRYAALRNKDDKGVPEEYCGVALAAEISFAQVRKLPVKKLISTMVEVCGDGAKEPVVLGERKQADPVQAVADEVVRAVEGG